MKKSLIFIIPIILALVSIGVASYYFSDDLRKQNLSDTKSTGEATIGGSFTLTDQDNHQVNDGQFRGKYMLVFFGFTNCPDICPVGLAVLTDVMEQLGDDAKKVQPIFISIDPERDTPERLKEFLANFDPSIIGLTGTPEQIKAVESAYKVYASKLENEDMPGGYNVDHSGFMYLMDKNAKYVKHFTYNAEATKMASDIKASID